MIKPIETIYYIRFVNCRLAANPSVPKVSLSRTDTVTLKCLDTQLATSFYDKSFGPNLIN